MRFKQHIQLEAVKAVVNGELLLEEAMAKYNIKNRRTILTWIKKAKPLLKTLPQVVQGIDTRTDIAASTLGSDHQSTTEHILQEIVYLRDKVSRLEKTNMQLVRHRDLLWKKIALLELRITIKKKEY